jgi:hypothetical protein
MTTIADRTTPDLTAEIKASGTKHYENNSEIPNATNSTHWSKMQVAPAPSPPANLQEMSASELRAMHDKIAGEAPGVADAAWNIPLDDLKYAIVTFQQAEKDAARADYSLRQAEKLAGVPPQPQQPETPPVAAANGEAPAEPVAIRKQADGTVEVLLETGERFVGSPDEVISRLAKAKLDTSYWGRGLSQQLKAMQEQPAQPAQPEYTQEYSPPNTASGAELGDILLNTAAQRLGVRDGNELLRSIDGLLASRQREEAQTTAARFMQQCPEFPVGNDQAYEVLDRVMAQNSWPLTADSMAAAHSYAVRYGLYQPLTQDQIRMGLEGPRQATIRRSTPPPTLPSGQPELSGGKNFWDMSPEEIKQDYFTRIARGES